MAKQLTRAHLSIRVPSQRWLSQEDFTSLLKLLAEQGDFVEELALFTAFTHAPLPLADLLRQMPLLKERLKQARAESYGCGVNILATIGHHNENLPNSLQGSYARRTDLAGRTCAGSFCPNDPFYVTDYVIPLYQMISQTGPDFIWIDDDIRSGHMSIGPDCFCDYCLQMFARSCGRLLKREQMAAYLNPGDQVKSFQRRQSWLSAQRATIIRLFRTIEKTVHQIDPAIELGFMTGERFLDGFGFPGQVKTLSGRSGQLVRWRPGGGFYRDSSLTQLTEKAHQIGRQVALLPKEVQNIQSEIENFNYEPLGKSIAANTAETAAYIAAGCTGAAFNVMNIYEDVRAEKSALFAAFSQERPFYDLLVQRQGRLKPAGILAAWNQDSLATVNLTEDWFAGAEKLNLHYADQWFEIGLPVAYQPEAAQAVFFKGNAPYAYSRQQLRQMLSGAVLIDAPALTALNDLGFADLTGFTVKHYLHEDCIEELTQDQLNGAAALSQRDCRQSFWPEPCADLLPSQAGTRVLARALDYAGQEKAACTWGIYENELGGRICVGGYYPWSFVQSQAKAGQCRRLLRWLTKDKLSAYLDSLHKICLWARSEADGNLVLTLFSQSLDHAYDLSLKVRTKKTKLQLNWQDGQEMIIQSVSQEGPYTGFIIPQLGPWRLLSAQTI